MQDTYLEVLADEALCVLMVLKSPILGLLSYVVLLLMQPPLHLDVPFLCCNWCSFVKTLHWRR